jgi:hypothetical protein
MVQMFGPGAPPLPWDTAGEYSRQRVELYYLTHGGKALSEVRRSDASSRPGNLIPPPPLRQTVWSMCPVVPTLQSTFTASA